MYDNISASLITTNTFNELKAQFSKVKWSTIQKTTNKEKKVWLEGKHKGLLFKIQPLDDKNKLTVRGSFNSYYHNGAGNVQNISDVQGRKAVSRFKKEFNTDLKDWKLSSLEYGCNTNVTEGPSHFYTQAMGKGSNPYTAMLAGRGRCKQRYGTKAGSDGIMIKMYNKDVSELCRKHGKVRPEHKDDLLRIELAVGNRRQLLNWNIDTMEDLLKPSTTDTLQKAFVKHFKELHLVPLLTEEQIESLTKKRMSLVAFARDNSCKLWIESTSQKRQNINKKIKTICKLLDIENPKDFFERLITKCILVINNIKANIKDKLNQLQNISLSRKQIQRPVSISSIYNNQCRLELTTKAKADANAKAIAIPFVIPFVIPFAIPTGQFPSFSFAKLKTFLLTLTFKSKK